MKNKMKLLMATAACLAVGLSLLVAGCATNKTTTTQSVANGQTNTVTTTSSKADPLLSKVIMQKESFTGLRLHIFGGTSMSPAVFDMGRGTIKTLTIPTSAAQIYSAQYNDTASDNIGWFNQAFADSTTTIQPGLPNAAYVQPQISTANPLTLQVVGSNGVPIASVPVNVVTNAVPVPVTTTNTP
jgi:hypothetical protein